MQRIVKIWPITRYAVRRALRAVGMTITEISVTWVRHKIGRIKFHIKLPLKYALLPDSERKWRTVCAFSDRVLDCRTRLNQRWVLLTFVLDCSQWACL